MSVFRKSKRFKDTKTYQVVFSYQPQNDDELALEVGNEISDIKDVGNGWVVAYNKSSGLTGLCPKDYLSRQYGNSKIDRMKNRVSTMYLSLTTQPIAKGNIDVPLRPESPTEGRPSFGQAQTRSQKITRILTGILVGLLLGGVIFAALSFPYQYSYVQSAAIAGGITLIMCLFLVIFPHARCVAALMTVSVFTEQGRAAFLSFIPGLLLAGPILNMQTNINEAADSVACISEVVFNQSLALHHQLTEPVLKQQETLESAARTIERKVARLQAALKSFHTEVNRIDVTGGGMSARGGPAVVMTECQRKLASMELACDAKVEETHNSCLTFTKGRRRPTTEPPSRDAPLAFFFPRKCDSRVCDPINKDAMCDYIMGSDICKLTNTTAIRVQIKTVNERIAEIDQLVDFRLNSSAIVDIRANVTNDPIQKVKELKLSLQQKIETTVYVFGILNKILILFLIYALIEACLYLRGYLRVIGFDNIYVGGQLKNLDMRLKEKKQNDPVLPLQKEETKIYIDSSSLKLCPAESMKWKMGLSHVILHIMIAALVILIDYGMYYSLQIIQQNGDVDFLVSGGVWVMVNVSGSSIIADVFRALVDGHTVSQEFNDVLNFQKCLPTASSPNVAKLYLIFTLYILAIIFVVMQAYGLRLRHKMAAFFFPARETRRVHFLYRHILLTRRLREEESKTVNLLKDTWSPFDENCHDEKRSSISKV